MSDREYTPVQESYCSVCRNSCIHGLCRKTTLTLTDLVFLVLAESINGLRQQLNQKQANRGNVALNPPIR